MTGSTVLMFGVVPMSDLLVDVAVRVYADYAESATLCEVLALVDHCRADLDTVRARAA
jgi:hypothetical protein